MLVYVLISLQIIIVQAINYQKPIAEKVWSDRCKKNEHVLNDCNWCWCGQDHHFKCKARVCEEVDMFGHFKDTIQEIDVGMEGHGAWRSRPTSCTPGVQYRRGTVLCVCDDDGSWPNPVCRDLFRILHSIEVTENVEESTSQICSPTKLYLVGCNACFCPESGKLDANLCTNRTCSDGDPVLEPKDDDKKFKDAHAEIIDDTDHMDSNTESFTTQAEIAFQKNKDELEIYAPCNPPKTYTIERQSCECLTNNRLVCRENDENTTRGTKIKQNQSKSLCSGKIGNVIQIECNWCKCTQEDDMYCTTKKCIPNHKGLEIALKKMSKFGKPVKAPIDDLDCVPGTVFKRGCNICYCKFRKGKKFFGCTVKPCRKPTIYDMARDCVADTSYETDCYICSCGIIDGEKHQVCVINSKCRTSKVLKESRSTSLDSLHGYCEPLHEYRKDCNTCRCLSDGKIVRCTTRLCTARSSEPIEVEVVPLKQAVSESCPKGHSYKVGCNLCFCLSNGNALCTTTDCSKKTD